MLRPMARKKEFDQDQALEQAMQVFWLKGYEATSIQDLVQQMGINRGSLYDTFGDKRSLFLSAIAFYDAEIVSAILQGLEQPGSAKQAIHDYLHAFVHRAHSDPQGRGCLITNAAVELSPHDSEVKARVVANLSRIESALCRTLRRAQQQGEISEDKDPKVLARFLLNTLQGLRVITKVDPDPERLQDIVTTTLAILD